MTGADIAALARALRSGEADPVELVEDSLAELARWEPALRCTIRICADEARAAAGIASEELRRGEDRGPLHGIPIGVKDIIDVAGMPTTAASRLLEGNIASANAPVVDSLLAAGAIVLAKTNTHEFAFGALTPPTRNPYDVSRMPGGSSGGSAAIVGAGIVRGAVGTDTAGSIREPAAMCGAVGLKPTAGLISNDGVIPLAWSLDTVGPIAASVADCRLMLEAMTGTLPPPSSQLDVTGCSFVVWKELTRRFQAPIRAAFGRAVDRLSDAGARVEERSLGEPDELVAACLVVLGGEALSYHRPWYETRRDEYQPDVVAYLDLSATFSAADYVDGERLRRAFTAEVDSALSGCDAILTPAQIIIPPPAEDTVVTLDDGRVAPRDLSLIRPLAPFNLTGHPAVSVPVAFDDESGLPVSVQLVGRRGEDYPLLDLAALVQDVAGFQPRRPEPPVSR